MRLRPLVASALCAATLAGGCAAERVRLGTDHPDEAYTVVADVPPRLSRALDLLFVVDNTERMAVPQLALTASFHRLLAHLEFVEGGVPDLHVGVVSTDLGTGPYAGGRCDAAGDRGLLQAEPRAAGCAAPSDRFLADGAAGDGERLRNFAGALEDAFSCIAALGEQGCGYEQPLESMRRALDGSNPENEGFLRPEAVLGLVVLSGEDDCSAFQPELFDPDADWLGPSSFRCFRYGVECHGDDVSLPGRRQGCRPRADSPYLRDVDGYVDFLYGRKADSGSIVVSGLMGDSSLIEVSVDLDGAPQLVPSCQGGGDGAYPAYPAVRLQGFLDGFPQQSEFTSICSAIAEPSGALAATGRRLRKALGTRCLDGDLADAEPGRAGLQPDCRVTAIPEDAGGAGFGVPACDEPYDPTYSSELPCYTLLTGPAACGDFPTQLAVTVVHDPALPAPPPARVVVECIVQP